MPNEEEWTFDKAEETMNSIVDWWQSHFLKIVYDELNNLPEPYLCVLKGRFIEGLDKQAIMVKTRLNPDEAGNAIVKGMELMVKRVSQIMRTQSLTNEKMIEILLIIGQQIRDSESREFLRASLFSWHSN